MGGKKISERSIKRRLQPTHPDSRRAAQLARVRLRKQKLQGASKARGKQVSSKVDRILTMILLLPEEKAFLPDLYSLHDFVTTFYLDRHSDEMEEILGEKRVGRPPSKREVELTDLMQRERIEYRQGIEIPDLCSEVNVKLLREWKGDPQALPMFRMVRISGTYRDQCTVIQQGNHKLLSLEREKAAAANGSNPSSEGGKGAVDGQGSSATGPSSSGLGLGVGLDNQDTEMATSS
ncbi:hypothetical protein IE53DRAFT_389543 [Violaceomyces palustris]|uniref:Uncharacterized protein n=1 Tax=Violaceomyces palustris TaxID=1673888 RepID=A0ACD0NR60_9BASI|nr:hypothetical protein IE53DRAFT_389543 [Violaceomyces palustris]